MFSSLSDLDLGVHHLRDERADFRSARADCGLERDDFLSKKIDFWPFKPHTADFWPQRQRVNFKPGRANFSPERADFGPMRPDIDMFLTVK